MQFLYGAWQSYDKATFLDQFWVKPTNTPFSIRIKSPISLYAKLEQAVSVI